MLRWAPPSIVGLTGCTRGDVMKALFTLIKRSFTSFGTDRCATLSAAIAYRTVFGLATALWSASGLFGELRTALNSVWDVDRARPMLRAKVQDLWLLSTFGGLLALSTASTGVLTAARDAGARWLGPLADVASPVFVALLVVAPFLLTLAAFLCLYRLAP